MSPRLPTSLDFPPSLSPSLTIIPPPPSPPSQPLNILLLLHGLGDTSTPFTNLARSLALPHTTCLTLRAPTPLPFDLGGFHWGDDLIFDQNTGEMEIDSGFSKAVTILKDEVIEKGLIKRCGYTMRDIIILGYGQGGMAALALASSIPPAQDSLGGIISIGGPLPSSCKDAREGKSKTPVLVLGGSQGTAITKSKVEELKARFDDVEYHKWNKSGDDMPRNREEMIPIMRFFARRLRTRMGVPEGSVEIT